MPDVSGKRQRAARWRKRGLRATRRRSLMKWTSWLAAVTLVGIAAVVVLSSLNVGNVRCEVCVSFRGREACRSVEAATEEEALRGARDNACALISSGVTDTLACQRQDFTTTSCGPS
jgi:hypothetical protein